MPDLTDLFGGSATQRQAKCLFVDRRGAGVGETTSGHVTVEDRGSPVPSRYLVLCSLGPAVEHLKPYLSPAPFALPHLAFAMRTLPTVESTLKRFCYAQMGYAVHVGVCN